MIRQDLLYALRQLRKSPIYSAVVIVVLGVGLGANTAIFSVVNRVLLRPLSYPESDRLYVIHEVVPQFAKSAPVMDANLPDFLIWQQKAQSFDAIAITESTSAIVAGAGDTQQIRGTRASANFLAMLGVRTALGRLFSSAEDAAGQGQVVILTDAFWRNRLHADPRVVGRSLNLDGVPHRSSAFCLRIFKCQADSMASPSDLSSLFPSTDRSPTRRA